MSIQLYNVAVSPNVLVAKLDDQFNVLYIHPALSDVIDKQKGVSIPVFKTLTAFGGLSKIPRDHEFFGKALVIHLNLDFATHPESYKWLEGEKLAKTVLKTIK